MVIAYYDLVKHGRKNYSGHFGKLVVAGRSKRSVKHQMKQHLAIEKWAKVRAR